MNDTEEIKEVLATFGAAALAAQSLERQLAITLATALAPDGRVQSVQQYDELLQAYFHRTAGQLGNLVNGSGSALLDLKEDIKQAVQRRNFLMHHYFWDRAVAFTSSEGRKQMIEELSDIRNLFEAVDARLTLMASEWGTERGVTADDYAAAMDAIINGKSLFS